MSITVSLIVPVYNGGKFAAGLCRHFAGLHEAVEGIEFIVVNDGFIDDTSAQFRQRSLPLMPRLSKVYSEILYATADSRRLHRLQATARSAP